MVGLVFLYKRKNFVGRTLIMSRPAVTQALWVETKTLFLNDTCTFVQTYNIADELRINVEQALSEYVPNSSVNMSEKIPSMSQSKGLMISMPSH